IAQGARGLPFALPAADARRALMAVALATVLASPLAFSWQLRWAGYHRDQEQLIRAYLDSHDAKLLRGAPRPSLAYPDPGHLQQLLDDPDVVSSLASTLGRRD